MHRIAAEGRHEGAGRPARELAETGKWLKFKVNIENQNI
jgi:hypothetical protein